MRISAGVCALLCASGALAASPQQLAESARLAETAFFTADPAALVASAKSTAGWDRSNDPAERYAAAYREFRLAQLATLRHDEDEVERAGEACVAHTDAALRSAPQEIEAFALQSACYGYLAALGGFGAISNGRRSGKAIAAATALAPHNPRVLLVDAISLQFRPKIAGGDKAKAYIRYREAAAAFDAASSGASHASSSSAAGQPAWGHAEAWYWVGRGAEAAGDNASARRAYERAYALAPTFSAAQRRLKAVAGGNRADTNRDPKR